MKNAVYCISLLENGNSQYSKGSEKSCSKEIGITLIQYFSDMDIDWQSFFILQNRN